MRHAAVVLVSALTVVGCGDPPGGGRDELIFRIEPDTAVADALETDRAALVARLAELSVDFTDAEVVVHDGAMVIVRGIDGGRRDMATYAVESALPGFAASFAGGELVAEMPESKRAGRVRDALAASTPVVRRRLQLLGIDADVATGDGLIVVTLAADQRARAARVISRQGRLAICWVEDGPHATHHDALARHNGRLPATLRVVPQSSADGTSWFIVRREPLLDNAGIAGAEVGTDAAGDPAVDFIVDNSVAGRFTRATRASVGRELAIIVDGELLARPVVRSEIGQRGQIPGGFTADGAAELAAALAGGVLPAPLRALGGS